MNVKEEVIAVVSQANQAEGEQELSKEVSLVETQAQNITVTSDDDYKMAAEFGRMLKRKSAEVVEFFAPMKKSAHDAHKQICDREKAMLAPIASAEKIIKKAMGAYQMEQERKRREEEERLRRLAKEEEERLLAEAIKMDELGENEMADEHLENAQFVADAAKHIVVNSAPTKAEGVSTSKDWEIVRIDSSLVPTEVYGQTIRPVDIKAIMRIIRANKGNVSIPGIEFKEIAKMSFRK